MCEVVQQGRLAFDIEVEGGSIDAISMKAGLEDHWIWQGMVAVNEPVCVNFFDALADGALVSTLSNTARLAGLVAEANVCWTLNWTRTDAALVYEEDMSVEIRSEARIFGATLYGHRVRTVLVAACPILWRIGIVVGLLVLGCCFICCRLRKRRRFRDVKGRSMGSDTEMIEVQEVA